MQAAESSGTDGGNAEIEIGASCKNRGCTARYSGPNQSSECVYHPGGPVFHEGMKFWSCCHNKTSEFDEFMSQVGCETGHHCWKRKGERDSQVVCRSDSHQTTNLMTINFYAKLCDPAKSSIRASSTELEIRLEYDGGNSILDRRIQLFGNVDPLSSCVKMGAKVEVILAKMDRVAWPKLEFVPPPSAE